MKGHRISLKNFLTGGILLLNIVVLLVILMPEVVTKAQGSSADWQTIATERGLTEADLRAAAMTYTPSGKHDEFIMFASGGHSGQVLVIGVPSMRLLRTIGVFTPEPWQGYGYGIGNDIIENGAPEGSDVSWGDTHHPALSETNGEYDGQWLFINDKANGRIAVIDLRDFETKQIVNNPLFLGDHGGTFVTPNTEYIIQGGQYSTPLGAEYAPIAEYQDKYRGMITFWKFDRATGRIDMSKSFAMELPPYWQDLCDAGKLVSDGWVFCNSINSGMATGGIESGNPPFEAGVSRDPFDYLHIINLKAAVSVFEAGNTSEIAGMQVITMDTAVANNLLFFTPEMRSPHGVDISPTGEFIVASGKLDPHVTIYSFDKIQTAIANSDFEGTDMFGIPILTFDNVVEARVELGLGPLHTQFGPDGYAYTSLFLDSAVARWSIGAEGYRPQDGWSLISKIPVQYNVGHISLVGGDTVAPTGQYLVSLNKWSIDRFSPTGPLLPQNFQLIDVSQPGDNMQVLYDMPITAAEPHYAQMIRADKLSPWEVYPEVGWDPATQSVSPNMVVQGEEGVFREGNEVNVRMTAIRSHFSPEHVEIKVGDKVTWTITSYERALDATHGFAVPYYNIVTSIEPGETVTFEFEATRDGVFAFYCVEFCSALHLEMMGYMTVQP
jgi:nitrous-oxide reductase